MRIQSKRLATARVCLKCSNINGCPCQEYRSGNGKPVYLSGKCEVEDAKGRMKKIQTIPVRLRTEWSNWTKSNTGLQLQTIRVRVRTEWSNRNKCNTEIQLQTIRVRRRTDLKQSKTYKQQSRESAANNSSPPRDWCADFCIRMY